MVHIELLPSPHSPHHSPATRHSSFTCAALPPLNRPPISGAAYRVWMLMRRAWVKKWCVRVAASDVGDCCRRRVWLLKDTICEIVSGSRQSAYISVHLRFISNCCPAPTPFSHFYTFPPPVLLHLPALPFLPSHARTSLALWTGCGCTCAER